MFLLTAQRDGDEEDEKNHEDISSTELEWYVWQEYFEEHAQWDSEDGRPDGSRRGGAFPEKSESEDDGDTRIDESWIFLNVLERLVKFTQQRSCCDNRDDKRKDSW